MTRIMETEIDLATGIVIEPHGLPEPRQSGKDGLRRVVFICVLAGLLSGVAAAGWLAFPATGRWSGHAILGTGLNVAALRPGSVPRGLGAYRGLGVWARASEADAATVTGLAGRGVQTVFVELAEAVPPGPTPDPGTARLLQAAHRRGLRVVAWYRPAGKDVAFDLVRLRAIASHTTAGERFDGVAVDLTIADPADSEAVDRLEELSRGLRESTGDDVLAAIVHPDAPPSAELKALYDVWVLATGKAPADEVAALRAELGEDAAVHLRGDLSGGEADARRLLAAAAAAHAHGVSARDYRVASNAALDVLAAGARPDGFGEEALDE